MPLFDPVWQKEDTRSCCFRWDGTLVLSNNVSYCYSKKSIVPNSALLVMAMENSTQAGEALMEHRTQGYTFLLLAPDGVALNS